MPSPSSVLPSSMRIWPWRRSARSVSGSLRGGGGDADRFSHALASGFSLAGFQLDLSGHEGDVRLRVGDLGAPAGVLRLGDHGASASEVPRFGVGERQIGEDGRDTSIGMGGLGQAPALLGVLERRRHVSERPRDVPEVRHEPRSQARRDVRRDRGEAPEQVLPALLERGSGAPELVPGPRDEDGIAERLRERKRLQGRGVLRLVAGEPLPCAGQREQGEDPTPVVAGLGRRSERCFGRSGRLRATAQLEQERRLAGLHRSRRSGAAVAAAADRAFRLGQELQPEPQRPTASRSAAKPSAQRCSSSPSVVSTA